MRAIVAVLLAGLMLVPSASALHDRPIAPAEQPARTFREVIFQVNDTISRIEEQVGDDPQLRQARDKLSSAAEAHNRGSHWITLSRLLEAVSLARRAQVEYETRDASDPQAAYFSQMESKWRESRGWIKDIHRRLIDLQSTGVDLWDLDHILLAGSILAKAERMHKAWGGIAKAWEKGQRGGKSKNALAAFSYGVILYIDIADTIITKGLQNQPDEPVGPVVGNSTLQGIMESLKPLVRNRSVSFDRAMISIINGNMASDEWLAALGASVAWSQKQAPAAVQHTLDEPNKGYDPENVTQHLNEVVHDTAILEEMDDLGVPGAQARFSIPHATAALRIALNETESGQASQSTALQAAEGLGAMSAAQMSHAILKLAAGEDPPQPVVFLPAGGAGGLELADNSTDRANGGSGGNDIGSGWLWLGALGALGLAAAVVHRRRRRR